jgi:predicted metal-dependent enzyme (double-stranded beta helix superfamily)
MRSTKSADWPWPDALDALIAAPGFHRLLFENERARVLEVRIAPGEFVPVHTHRWPSVMIVHSASNFLRRNGARELLFDSRDAAPEQNAPGVIWSPALPPHSVENIGSSEIHIVSVELKEEVF